MNSSTDLTEQKRLVLYFQVHQPIRLNKYQFFDIGTSKNYFDDELNRHILQRVARECYLPVNAMLLEVITLHPQVKICFSVSGVTLDALSRHAPEVIESFKRLAGTGSVEFLAETSYHSLACLISTEEFQKQVLEQREKIASYFGVYPSVVRNTELIYNDEVGRSVSALGFEGVLCDGVDYLLNSSSPYKVYRDADDSISILLRANRLSDDIAFRFERDGSMLGVNEYTQWLYSIPSDDEVIMLGMDYETFGEHQKKDSGIVLFLQNLLLTLVRDKRLIFSKPSEVIRSVNGKEKLSVPAFTSWADEKKDLSAWLDNDMQREAFNTIKDLQQKVKDSQNMDLLTTWRNLQTSDHFYYMSTKQFNDGSVHSYFSHYPSPYEAFINYMNVIKDFTRRVEKEVQNIEARHIKEEEYHRQHPAIPVWAIKQEADYMETH